MKNITIIKIGSSLIVDDTGAFREQIIQIVLQNIQKEQQKGNQVLLVSSGAVAVGRSVLQKNNIPNESREIAAAVGQLYLMSLYKSIAETLDLTIAQILVSRPHLVERELFLKFQQTIAEFRDKNILPIINENDVMVTDTAWGFGDNDTLSASLAISFAAKRLIILSHIDGLYTADPSVDSTATLISEVHDINQELMKYCDVTTSSVGRGGMISKMKAARLATNIGTETYIINGTNPDALATAFESGNVGTRCVARIPQNALKNRKKWVLVARTSAASIEVDNGAANAIQNGKSLLAVGITQVYGQFKEGTSVEILNNQKEGIAFGVVDISSEELLSKSFSSQHGVQVMHADNIVRLTS
ncbi:MAG: glutamate 5-kinase [Candidatus Magasanikbacteria bacterium CG_4_9_14_0_2_um_filter_41_10]|uniref:Glutamate 5-kinase n=1 Tax=Candidatus Magasanikbacteria bacterium CG_4_10_14_0_2_um_filter_41_31 TaxID=1974639 RepID=A0A2M7V4S5_9BACT|nr:MAG: glutamate 5-kinase [Candidatus Magasanikbacteria bacterium CG1_02_41_34]PIZ93538.1 MAG: glutamate 5-kinase [Candidatus Magasanikbacteria bacterium CG_4_10_14_0_2_um_filter_41_31]PJC53334.1 MAG: glutamate 5-kinase [Candidatus Magasanikbacteria bacterium CG_4_9_14_0_2_um_filter_41_10]